MRWLILLALIFSSCNSTRCKQRAYVISKSDEAYVDSPEQVIVD